MANQITAAELVANVRAKMDMLPGDMARAEQIIQSSAKRMGAGASTAGDGIGANIGKGIQTGLASFLGGGAGMLIGGAVAGGLATIAQQAISAAGELAALGRQSDRIGTSFSRLWGDEAPTAMDKLRAASMGAISDMDLMLSANKASMLGVGSGIDDLAKLMQVAQERGQALGLSASQAFNDIVTGIGRMSPLILDNLGIVTDAENTYAMYAEKIGKSADALTDMEKKQALVNRVTAEAGTVAMDAEANVSALAAAHANLRAVLGEGIAEIADSTGIAQAQTSAVASLTDTVRDFFDVLQGRTALGEYKDQLKAAYEAGQISAERYYELSDAVLLYNQRMALSGKTEAETTAALRAKSAALTEEVSGMGAAEIAAANLHEQQVRDAAAAFQAARAYGAAGNAASVMAGQLMAASKVQFSPYGYEIYGSATNGYAAVQQRVEYLKIENERRVTERQMEGGRQEQMARQLDAQRSYAAESVDIARDQFNEIRGIVESALSPTAVTAADLAATAAGTYVDKWDEYMRRIRMPESGLGADQIAEQERMFYSGQMLDQVNWSAVVSDVERRMQEEAGKEAMIQEAMRQVAAAGIGASQSQVAEALGVTDYGAGSGLTEALSTGLTAAGLGVQFTDEFSDEFEDQQDRWIELGSLSVRWMTQGMVEGVTPEVTGLLVSILAPRIQEALGLGARP